MTQDSGSFCIAPAAVSGIQSHLEWKKAQNGRAVLVPKGERLEARWRGLKRKNC